jgi:hypothetical protein
MAAQQSFEHDNRPKGPGLGSLAPIIGFGIQVSRPARHCAGWAAGQRGDWSAHSGHAPRSTTS